MIVERPQIASMRIAVAAYATCQCVGSILALLYISLPIPEACDTRKITAEGRWRGRDKAARVEIVAPGIARHTLVQGRDCGWGDRRGRRGRCISSNGCGDIRRCYCCNRGSILTGIGRHLVTWRASKQS